MNDITLAWGYGSRNAGDMAINYGTMGFLSERFPDVRPQMISRYAAGAPEISDTRRMLEDRGYDFELQSGPIRYNHKQQSQIEKLAALTGDGTRYLSDLVGLGRVHPRFESEMKSTIRDSDLLLFNGGNLIHHSPHRRFLPYVLAIMYPMEIARRTGTPYALLPQTMFDLEGPYQSRIEAVLNGAEFIWARDEHTFEYLKGMESVSTPVYNGLDIGFVGCRRYPGEHTDTGDRHIAVVPRFSELGDTGDLEEDDRNSVEDTLKRYMDDLVTDGDSVTLVVQTKLEAEWVDRNRSFLESANVDVFESFDQSELCSFYAGCDLLVTMRLHAGIFALTQGTPVVGIYREGWGPKLPGTWKALDVEKYTLSWEDVTFEELHSLTSEAVEDREELGADILERIDDITKDMVDKIESNVQII